MIYTVQFRAEQHTTSFEVVISDIENEQRVREVITGLYAQEALFPETDLKVVEVTVFKGTRYFWEGKSSVANGKIKPSLKRIY